MTAAPTTSSAPERFLADAICADANKKEQELGAEGPGSVGTEKFDDSEYLAEFNAVGRAALHKLKSLTPPPEADAKSMEEVIDSVARGVWRGPGARLV